VRYQKPIIIDLSSSARATGQDPLGCYSGNTPSGLSNWCQAGTNVTNVSIYTCVAGPVPDGNTFYGTCITGPAVTGMAGAICQTGTAGNNYGDTCTSGPQPV
jgi:hypothetical protein